MEDKYQLRRKDKEECKVDEAHETLYKHCLSIVCLNDWLTFLYYDGFPTFDYSVS